MMMILGSQVGGGSSLMDAFFPVPSTKQIMLVPRARLVDLLCGRARITNMPEGASPARGIGLLAERYAADDDIGIVLEFLSELGGVYRERFRAEIAE